MMLAMVTVASAGTPTNVPVADRTAGIEFTSTMSNDNDGVFDPGNPASPAVGAHQLQAMSIHFGEHDVHTTTRTFNSIHGLLTTGATPAPVTPYDGGGMTNGRAGVLIISSAPNWTVTAAIREFRTGNIETGTVVMNGFTLELLANNVGRPNDEPFVPNAATTLNLPAATISVASGAATVASSAQAGVFGTNFEGNLTVLGGTAPANAQPQAIMDWALVVGP